MTRPPNGISEEARTTRPTWNTYMQDYPFWETFSEYADVRDRHVAAMANPDCTRCTRVADLGCGPGIVTIALLKQDFYVCSFDKNRVALDFTENRIRTQPDVMPYRKNVRFEHADVTRLSENWQRYRPGMVDGAVSMYVYNFLREPRARRYFSEAARLTRRGGKLSVSGPIPGWKWETIRDAFQAELEERGWWGVSKIEEVFARLMDNLKENKERRSVYEPEPEELAHILRHELGEERGYVVEKIEREDVFVGQSFFIEAVRI
jgi:SAM-dependent methyltransferase